MIEFRKDKYTDSKTLINTLRGERPHNMAEFLHHIEKLQHKTDSDISPECPFCVGNEEKFTPVWVAARYATDGSWLSRIVPNKYPGITAITDDYKYEANKPKGYHDVFIETKNHNENLGELSVEDVAANLNLLIDRIRVIESDKRMRHVTLFKNYGEKAGASQFHAHWQLIASDMEIPVGLTNGSGCLSCRFMEHKDEAIGYEIYSDEDMVVYTPFVSDYAYKVIISPRQHITKLTDLPKRTIQKTASMVKYMVQALESIDAPYNIYTSYNINDDKHLVTAIVPRIHIPGGFELSTGININPVNPADAANFYKKFIYR